MPNSNDAEATLSKNGHPIISLLKNNNYGEHYFSLNNNHQLRTLYG